MKAKPEASIGAKGARVPPNFLQNKILPFNNENTSSKNLAKYIMKMQNTTDLANQSLVITDIFELWKLFFKFWKSVSSLPVRLKR